MADHLVMGAAGGRNSGRQDPSAQLRTFLAQVDSEVASMELGMFRRARLASSFKGRLIDGGFEPDLANELTRLLLTRLSAKPAVAVADEERFATTATRPNSTSVEDLLSQAQASAARGDHAEVVDCYQQLLKSDPGHLLARNNLGVALWKLSDYAAAEKEFRRAIAIEPSFPDAHFNLGSVLRWMGQVVQSEAPLRQAVELAAAHVDARTGLGLTLMLLGRMVEARECFEKVLQAAPRHSGALCGVGQIASLEGRFDEAEAMFKRALVFDTQMPAAWAGLVSVRKMTPADSAWLKSAEKIASSGIESAEEAGLRFAIGKYCDDVGNFEQAFRSYTRANELRKKIVPRYDRAARARLVDDLIRVYPVDAFAAATHEVSDSALPVFVTGMMRSGTSLVEQIISSHPHARGAGELQFWSEVVHKHEQTVRNRWLEEPLRARLAEEYLRALSDSFPQARRVVDKATFNSDYLGLIHSALPHARLIYVRRDPIDTCLSCYFHQFASAHNFTMDLGDLAHYYREHWRLFEHWRAVLPAGTLLEVPYAELVADQGSWTRRIVDFIGLEWDERCLDFHRTQRPVITASFWQVRQRIYKSSVQRWRHYEKFIGPLRELQSLHS